MNEVALRELELSHYTPECNILNDLYFKDLSEKYQEALDKLPRQCQNIFRMNALLAVENVDFYLDAHKK